MICRFYDMTGNFCKDALSAKTIPDFVAFFIYYCLHCPWFKENKKKERAHHE